jgi:hypothetical protein
MLYRSIMLGFSVFYIYCNTLHIQCLYIYLNCHHISIYTLAWRTTFCSDTTETYMVLSHIAPDNGLSGPKYVGSEVITTFVCVMITSPFFICRDLCIAHWWHNFVIHKDLQFNFCTHINRSFSQCITSSLSSGSDNMPDKYHNSDVWLQTVSVYTDTLWGVHWGEKLRPHQ